MKPIIDPDGLSFDSQRFPLAPGIWQECVEQIRASGVSVTVEAKQYIEYCLEDQTEIIAIQGQLYFKGMYFQFTAQLDVQGYGLYVTGLTHSRDEAEKLRVLLQGIFN